MTKPKAPKPAGAAKTAHQKGTELEQAIGAIERAILSANPNLSEKAFDIRFRKLIVEDGVKHEIDVWIGVDLGDGYKSLFIFEARNWKKRIGKDHIIVFSEKIKASGAQAGFFVAKSFTRYAVAAAKNDRRIHLIKAGDDFVNHDAIDHFHSTHQDQSRSEADFQIIVKPPSQPTAPPASFDMRLAKAMLNGVEIDYVQYGNALVAQVIRDHACTVQSQTMADGEYFFDVESEVPIGSDKLIVDGFEVERIRIKLKYPFRIVRAPVVSKFDIESRGRVYTYAGVSLGPFGVSKVTVVERDGRLQFLVSIDPA